MPIASEYGFGLRVGEQADDRLEQRRGGLVGERDQADLPEVERVGVLEDRIDRRQDRLHQVVEHVAEADRAQDAERGLGCRRRANGRRGAEDAISYCSGAMRARRSSDGRYRSNDSRRPDSDSRIT